MGCDSCQNSPPQLFFHKFSGPLHVNGVIHVVESRVSLWGGGVINTEEVQFQREQVYTFEGARFTRGEGGCKEG